LAVEHARGTRKPLGHSAGRCGVQGGGRGGGGGSAQQSSPACGAPAATEGYGLRNCVQKVRGKQVGAHRALNWTGKWRSGVGGGVRRRGVDRRRFSTRIHGRSGGCGRKETGLTGGVPAQRDGASASGVPLAGGTGRSGGRRAWRAGPGRSG